MGEGGSHEGSGLRRAPRAGGRVSRSRVRREARAVGAGSRPASGAEGEGGRGRRPPRCSGQEGRGGGRIWRRGGARRPGGVPSGNRAPRSRVCLPQEPHLLPGLLTIPPLRLSLGPFPSSSSFLQKKSCFCPPPASPTFTFWAWVVFLRGEIRKMFDWAGERASFFDPYFLSLRVN